MTLRWLLYVNTDYVSDVQLGCPATLWLDESTMSVLFSIVLRKAQATWTDDSELQLLTETDS